jgi:23S rRNA pseudouridine1911/1915/1917 synthase
MSNTLELVVPENLQGSRLDIAVTSLIADTSRSRIQKLIKSAQLLVNYNCIVDTDYRLMGGETITLNKDFLKSEQLVNLSQDIPLEVIYQDHDLIVINKPAGLIVHPGHGHWSNTLLNGLLFHYPELVTIARGGIVHRLDKDTSGLMVIARSDKAHLNLVNQLKNRTVCKIYHALVDGYVNISGTINKNIGRDTHNRIKMRVLDIGGKEAITHYTLIKHIGAFSYIECNIETGRTHQIRVHMSFIGHPVVGDSTYGKLLHTDSLCGLKRQALHAKKIIFNHPSTLERMEFNIEPPGDMQNALHQLSSM